MIKASNIQLSFNGKTVLKDLAFEIGNGENVCFSGASGKGKSSLLKMLQGYILPDAGTISVNGLELNEKNIWTIRSNMAYIPQNVNLPVKNGVELLELITGDKPADSVFSIAARLGIPETMLEQGFDEISGGQKQRIVIAVCLSLDREIILLDEPTSSLDDESIGKLMNVLKGPGKRTVVSASHNHEWIRFADRSIAL